jgi:hypothetical protein
VETLLGPQICVEVSLLTLTLDVRYVLPDFQLLSHVGDRCTPFILVVTVDFEAVGKDHEVVRLDGVRVDGGVHGGGGPSESTRDESSEERNTPWT